MANQISFTGSLFISIYTTYARNIHILDFSHIVSPLRMVSEHVIFGHLLALVLNQGLCLARHLVASETCLVWQVGAPGMQWVEARENTVYSAHNMVAPHNKGLSGLECDDCVEMLF